MDDADRAALAARHLELPRRAAAILHPRVRDHIELDELIAAGNLGLAEAARRYDPASGAAFATYAWYRVQGAIVDAVRRRSSLPRGVWAQVTALAATAAYLEAASTRAEVAREQTVGGPAIDQLRAVRDALGAIRTMYVVSLDAVPAEALVSQASNPEAALGRARQSARVQAAVARLPARERQLLHAHYVEGQTLGDAGAAMGLSKSWTSRLHARAIDRLRVLLTERPPRGQPG